MITLGQAKFTAFGKLATAVTLSAAFCSAPAQDARDNAVIADGDSNAVIKPWNDSEHERRFRERCAILREFAEQPDFPCVYTPPEEGDVLDARGTPVSWSAIEAP